MNKISQILMVIVLLAIVQIACGQSVTPAPTRVPDPTSIVLYKPTPVPTIPATETLTPDIPGEEVKQDMYYQPEEVFGEKPADFSGLMSMDFDAWRKLAILQNATCSMYSESPRETSDTAPVLVNYKGFTFVAFQQMGVVVSGKSYRLPDRCLSWHYQELIKGSGNAYPDFGADELASYYGSNTVAARISGQSIPDGLLRLEVGNDSILVWLQRSTTPILQQADGSVLFPMTEDLYNPREGTLVTYKNGDQVAFCFYSGMIFRPKGWIDLFRYAGYVIHGYAYPLCGQVLFVSDDGIATFVPGNWMPTGRIDGTILLNKEGSFEIDPIDESIDGAAGGGPG